MLNYTITIAISAFFVPHYIGGAVLGAAAHGPGRHRLRHRRRRRARRRQRRRRQGVGRASTSRWPSIDFVTQLLLVLVGVVLVFSPETLVDNVDLGVAPTLEGLLPRDPGRDDRLHRDRDDLQHGRGGQGRGARRSRRRSTACVIAVFAIYAPLPAVALSRAAGVRSDATASTSRCSACPRRRAASPATRSSASSSRSTSGRCRAPAEIYVGLLAATILFIATNAGIIGVSRLVYSMGLHRQVPDRLRQLHPRFGTPWIGILRLRRRRLRGDDPGPGRVPGQHVRVRGDAVVHDRPPRGHPPARQPSPTRERPYRGPGQRCASRGRDLPLFAVLGGLGTAPGVRRRHRAAPRRRGGRRRLAGARLR